MASLRRGGLSSKKVAVIVWHRNIGSVAAQGALKDEVDYMVSYGYAVYLVRNDPVGPWHPSLTLPSTLHPTP